MDLPYLLQVNENGDLTKFDTNKLLNQVDTKTNNAVNALNGSMGGFRLENGRCAGNVIHCNGRQYHLGNCRNHAAVCVIGHGWTRVYWHHDGSLHAHAHRS